MHSHSFQDEELKLHKNVDDSPGQVVEGVVDSTLSPEGSEIKG